MGLSKSELKLYKSLQPGSDGGTIDLDRVIENNATENLFQNVPHEDAVSGQTEYRKFFIKNTNANLSWFNVKLYIFKQVQGNAEVVIGLGTATDTDGSAITYYKVETEETAITVSDIGPGESKAIWLRRIVQEKANAIQNDNCILMFSGVIAG